MSDPTNSPPPDGAPQLRLVSDVPRAVEPEAGATPARAADELVVQGLLESMHRGDAASRDERVRRFFESLEAPARAHRFPTRRVVKWGLGLAAAIVLGTTLIMIGVPGERTALAEVRQSIEAMRGVGDRRYEVALTRRGVADADADADVNAIIDMRSPNLLLIRHKPPGWTDFALGGRDEKGAWAILKDGSVTRDNPQQQWPPFVTDGGETFMTESVDRQLDQLPDLFTFAKAPGEPIGGAGKVFDRITATRTQRSGPKPTRVELWIDPATHLVERIEYRWDAASDGGPSSRSAMDGPDVGAGGVKGGPGGPRGGGGPPGRGGPGDDDDIGRPDGPGGPGGPSGPHGPHGPDDGHHDWDGGRPPPPPDHDHMDGPDGPPSRPPMDGRRGPGGPGGPGGKGGMGGPKGGMGPMGGGRASDRVVTFQRVDAPALPPDWFTPEGHAGK